jgi:hypothetical protein
VLSNKLKGMPETCPAQGECASQGGSVAFVSCKQIGLNFLHHRDKAYARIRKCSHRSAIVVG